MCGAHYIAGQAKAGFDRAWSRYQGTGPVGAPMLTGPGLCHRAMCLNIHVTEGAVPHHHLAGRGEGLSPSKPWGLLNPGLKGTPDQLLSAPVVSRRTKPTWVQRHLTTSLTTFTWILFLGMLPAMNPSCHECRWVCCCRNSSSAGSCTIGSGRSWCPSVPQKARSCPATWSGPA